MQGWHQARRRQVQHKLDEAYDDKLSGRITQEYFSEPFSKWREELAVTADKNGGADACISRNILRFMQTLEKLAEERLGGVSEELIAA